MTDIIMIPLTKLVESEDNVRGANRKAGIAELAACVKAIGLLQSIVVKDAGNGRFAVIAGARRLRALRLLAKAGDIEKNASIPCRVISGDDNAAELSLAENVSRVDLRLGKSWTLTSSTSTAAKDQKPLPHGFASLAANCSTQSKAPVS